MFHDKFCNPDNGRNALFVQFYAAVILPLKSIISAVFIIGYLLIRHCSAPTEPARNCNETQIHKPKLSTVWGSDSEPQRPSEEDSRDCTQTEQHIFRS